MFLVLWHGAWSTKRMTFLAPRLITYCMTFDRSSLNSLLLLWQLQEQVLHLMRTEEHDKRVAHCVVARRDDLLLAALLHQLCLDLSVERQSGLVFECYKDPFFRGHKQPVYLRGIDVYALFLERTGDVPDDPPALQVTIRLMVLLHKHMYEPPCSRPLISRPTGCLLSPQPPSTPPFLYARS
jgi:hypothetical protein